MMFQKEISQKLKNGGELINLGGVLQPWAHLGPLGSFYMKQAARLGEHVTSGELGGKLLPHFSYKWTLEADGKGFSTFGNQISLNISEEKKKEGEKSRLRRFRNASVMFL